ncbi:MAG: hypothetical protein ACM3WU_01050 [Bacillota bacterium]
MPRRGFRWEVIALSAVLTLAVLSLAYYSYESMGVKKPLERALLADPDVSDVRIHKDGGLEVVEVTLSRVADLSVAYTRLHAVISDKVAEGAFTLKVKDQRDEALQEVYSAIHYYLEEASVRGNFGAMIEACEPILDSSGATGYKITVDQERIYVQIESGDRYLYRVLDNRSLDLAGGGVTR